MEKEEKFVHGEVKVEEKKQIVLQNQGQADMTGIHYLSSSSLNLKERSSLPSSDFTTILHSWYHETVQE